MAVERTSGADPGPAGSPAARGRSCPELARLSGEHARWLAALAGARRGGAARLLALWDREIQPHCRGEEEVLLPELTCRLPETDALVVFTLGDHVALRRLARELRAARGPARTAAAAALARRLREHLAFEERTLFPALRATLGGERLAGLASELAGRGPPPAAAGGAVDQGSPRSSRRPAASRRRPGSRPR